MQNDEYGRIDRNHLSPLNGLTAPSALTPTPQPISLSGIIAASASNKLLQATVLDGVREHCSAMRVKTALDNMAALSAVEEQLQRVAPLGTERYRTILDAYALTLAIRITK